MKKEEKEAILKGLNARLEEALVLSALNEADYRILTQASLINASDENTSQQAIALKNKRIFQTRIDNIRAVIDEVSNDKLVW